MANGAFKFKDNSGNVVSFISGSGSNISFSGGTLDLSGMTGLTLGNLTLSGTTQNALSASHAASYLLTSSFNTYSGTTNTVIGTLQTSTSSLNSFTSSATTRLNSIETSTGSLNSYTSSNNTKLGVIESTTGSLNSYTSSNTTNVNAIHTSTGSLNTFTSSATTRLNNIETSTGSLNSFTSSTNNRLNSIEGVSGSYATTGSNQFKNDQVITGSLTVTGFIDAQELRTTYISSSILYRSGSTKFGDELSDTHSFTGSLLVSGTISVPGSNLVSGSSQVLNGSGVFSSSAQLPSGIVSGSAQTIANLPSGTVSGSVQVDVMSTTNIARLATTGSNVFTSNQIVTGSLTTTGNIGVGVTPSAWVSYNGFQIGNQGSIGATSTVINFGQNVYYGASGNSYIENGKAAMYQMNDGVHGWRISVSGTTGSAISFTDAMTLNASGNLGLGVTDLGPSGMSLSTNFNYSWSEGSGNAYAVLFRQRNSAATVVASGYKRSGTGAFASSYGISMARAAIAVGYNNGSIVFFSDAASNVANGTDITPTERLTLNASGNLGLGVTPSAWSLGSPVLQMGTAGVHLFGAGTQAQLGSNTYYNGTNYIYTTSSYATRYIQNSTGGEHGWEYAASGTAAGTITFVRAMTLSNSGNLSLTGNVTIGTANAGQPTLYLTRVGGYPTIKGSTANGGDGQIVIDGASNSSNVYLNNYVSSNVYLATGGGTTHSGLLIPHSNATFDLGSSANRWSTVYTSDLSMSNGIGDYTIVEGLEDLFLYNNKTNKVFKFMLQEVNPSEATPKKS